MQVKGTFKRMWTLLVIFLTCCCAALTEARDVCETRVCIERAKQFLDSMDTVVNPCDDFYQFSCGRFLSENNVDHEEKIDSVFTELESDLTMNLRRSLLKINSSDENTPRFMHQMRTMYDKCLDTNQIEEDGMNSLRSLLRKIDGIQFLDPSNWSASDFSLERRAKLFTEAGLITDFFLDMDFIPNLQNTSDLIINFSHSNSIDDQSLIKNLEEVDEMEEAQKEIQRFANFIFSIFRALSVSTTRKDVADIIYLTRRLLVAAHEIMELRKNVTNLVNVMTVEDLQSQFTALNWTEYIMARTFGQVNVTNSMLVNVMEMGYVKTIMEILEDTDPLIIFNYQTLMVIVEHMERVNKQMRSLKVKMSDGGIASKYKPRWKMCVDDIVEDFGMGISFKYVQDYGNENLKNFSIEIITRLKEQFEKMMSQSNWFDEETAAKAKEKLNAVVNQIAYSDELLNVTFVDAFYRGLHVENLSYFDSILHIRKIVHLRDVELFVDPSDFSNELQFVEVTLVNGFYVPFSNSIQIPMGILQSKFIDIEAPLFLNYGSMGFTMAHEISHAFDDFGRQFDLKGNVANWYSTRATELNSEKEKCIIDQFNAFTEPQTKLKLNGQNTLSENMADLGGILISYYSYKNAPARQGHDMLSLPGLNYTMDQQFWLAFSTTWCSSYRNSKLRNIIEYDAHSPAQFRINGALQNVEEFARDFNCPVGSPMNPEKKCTVF